MRKLTEDDLLVIVKSIIDITWNDFDNPYWITGECDENIQTEVLSYLSSDGTFSISYEMGEEVSISFCDNKNIPSVSMRWYQFPLPYEVGDRFEFAAVSDQFFEKVQSIIDVYRM